MGYRDYQIIWLKMIELHVWLMSLWYWQIKDVCDIIMLVSFFFIFRVLNQSATLQSVTKIPKLPPTHFVSNIDVALSSLKFSVKNEMFYIAEFHRIKREHPPRSCKKKFMVRNKIEVPLFLIVIDLLFQTQEKSRRSISKKVRIARFLIIVK